MSNTPKISIIIPVYNVEKYIRRCLESLLKNSIINDCEIIIVNDCSPDNSFSVIKNFLNEHNNPKNVLLYSHDCNRGLAAARNTGLLQAHGEYIICVDSDDWVEPDYLEKLYDAAIKNDADVVICDLVIERKNCSLIIKEMPQKEDYVKGLLSGSLHGWLPEKLIRRSLFMKYKISWIEGLNMCEDLLLTSKVFYVAKRIVHVQEPLYHYDCTNQNSLTYDLNENKVSQLKRVIEEIEEFLPNEYFEILKVQKSRIKIWILKGQKHPLKEDYELYNSERLSECKLNPFFSRIFFLFCEHRIFFLARLIILVKR